VQVHCRRHINTDINRLLRRHATSTTTTPSTHHSNTSTRQRNQSTTRTSQPSSPFRPAPVGNRYLPRAGTSCQNNFTVTAVFLPYRGLHTDTSSRSLPPASSMPTRWFWNVSTDDSGAGVPTPWDSTTTVTARSTQSTLLLVAFSSPVHQRQPSTVLCSLDCYTCHCCRAGTMGNLVKKLYIFKLLRSLERLVLSP